MDSIDENIYLSTTTFYPATNTTITSSALSAETPSTAPSSFSSSPSTSTSSSMTTLRETASTGMNNLGAGVTSIGSTIHQKADELKHTVSEGIHQVEGGLKEMEGKASDKLHHLEETVSDKAHHAADLAKIHSPSNLLTHSSKECPALHPEIQHEKPDETTARSPAQSVLSSLKDRVSTLVHPQPAAVHDVGSRDGLSNGVTEHTTVSSDIESASKAGATGTGFHLNRAKEQKDNIMDDKTKEEFDNFPTKFNRMGNLEAIKKKNYMSHERELGIDHPGVKDERRYTRTGELPSEAK